MCRQRSGVARMTDNPNTLEMIIHFLEVLVALRSAREVLNRKLPVPLSSEMFSAA
jgi:hypothetical protein